MGSFPETYNDLRCMGLCPKYVDLAKAKSEDLVGTFKKKTF